MAKEIQKFWNIKNLSKNKGELTLYGQIAQTSWWDDLVTPKQFVKDLKNLGDIEELDVRINSNGGDVFAGQTIYSLLKSHKASINVYIDGLAASIATIVAMAGDKITMSPGAMFMIHNPSSVAYGEAKDFIKNAEILNKVKECLIATYKAKVNLDEEELSEMMDNESWFTAEEALDKGFIDEISGVEIEACVNKSNQVFFNGIGFDISNYINTPKFKNMVESKKNDDLISTLNQSRESFKKIMENKAATPNNEEDEELNKEEFKNKYPEVYAEIVNEGAISERNRMKAIDDLAIPGNDEIINKAKYETCISAEQMAVEIIKAEKGKGTNYLNNRQEDVYNANVLNVSASNNGDLKTSKEEEEDAANNIANMINKRRGVK